MRTEYFFDSCGSGQIHVFRWMPEQTPKAVFQIVHGIAEFAERYDDFANFICNSIKGIVYTCKSRHCGVGRKDLL